MHPSVSVGIIDSRIYKDSNNVPKQIVSSLNAPEALAVLVLFLNFDFCIFIFALPCLDDKNCCAGVGVWNVCGGMGMYGCLHFHVSNLK